MKKFIVLFLAIILFLLGSYFAYDKHFRYLLPKEYKNEINALLEKEIPKVTQELDELPGRIEREKDPFDKEGLIEMGVDIVFFDFYWKIVHVTEKYVGKGKIINNLPPNDNVWEIHEVLIPYFKNNKINTSKIFALIKYGAEKQKIIEKKFANFSYFHYLN